VPLQFDDILPTLKVILAKLKAKSNVVDPCLGFMIESLRALLRTLPSVQGKEQNAMIQYANHITELDELELSGVRLCPFALARLDLLISQLESLKLDSVELLFGCFLVELQHIEAKTLEIHSERSKR
jgi:hypothetical protein